MERTCSIEGCENKLLARTWCSNHYRRWRSHGDPSAFIRWRATFDENGSNCSVCLKYKDWSNFFKTKTSSSGYNTICTLCLRCRTYNITSDDFEQMMVSQGFTCKICPATISERWSHIDHNHDCCSGGRSCGKCIRGILCPDCNIGIGKFKESPELLLSASKYLTNSKD